MAIFADDLLVASPGTRYHYSVFGYTLLSAAMEAAAADDGGSSLAPPLDFSYKWAGGGLSSTLRDLTRLGSAVLDPRFLSPPSVALLTTSQVTSSGEATDVAIAWRFGTDSRARRFIHHAGTISGGRAVLLVYPHHGVSVALTSNQALAPLMVEVTAQVLAEPFLLQQEGKHVDRLRAVGTYAFTWTARDSDHAGTLRYGSGPADDRMDRHPELARWAGGLGSPIPDERAPILPMLVSGDAAFIPVVTPAGAFAIDFTTASDGTFSGRVSGQFVRVSGRIRAERVEPN